MSKDLSVMANTELGAITERTAHQVRAAQLVLTSAAMGDPEREAEIRDVLSAVGIFNKRGRIETRASRPSNGLRRTANTPIPANRREPSGRLSRRGRPRSDKNDGKAPGKSAG
jgi:hypothetical protein